MVVRHIIFDLYGTLVDTDADLLCTKRGSLMRFGHSRWMVTDRDPEEYFMEYAIREGLDVNDLRESFERMNLSVCWFDGIPELLAELRDVGVDLHILSNAGRNTREFLDADGLRSFFDTVTVSFEIGVAKPDEDAFLAVLDRIGASPSECVMVGDSEQYDVVPARKLGMSAVHFAGRSMPVSRLRDSLFRVLKQ